MSHPTADLVNDGACGFDIITTRDLDKLGAEGIVEKLKDRVRGSRVYIFVDIDVLDPAYALGTETGEVGGWTTKELLTTLDSLSDIELIGADVVEVAPVRCVYPPRPTKTYLPTVV
jgi:agmatinase